MNKLKYQQGDVCIFEVDGLPEGVTPVKPNNGVYTLALGEATGHSHTVCVDDCKMFESADHTLFMVVEKETEVRHQEHKRIKMKPKTYKIGIVREADPFTEEINKVRD